MECVGDDVNSVFHEDQQFFKNDTFEIFGKCSESVGFHANIDLQDLKIFKSDTFENYTSSVPAEVQNHDPSYCILLLEGMKSFILRDAQKK